MAILEVCLFSYWLPLLVALISGPRKEAVQLKLILSGPADQWGARPAVATCKARLRQLSLGRLHCANSTHAGLSSAPFQKDIGRATETLG
jgi:hypothetical protein